jgi:hypothetical protein
VRVHTLAIAISRTLGEPLVGKWVGRVGTRIESARSIQYCSKVFPFLFGVSQLHALCLLLRSPAKMTWWLLPKIASRSVIFISGLGGYSQIQFGSFCPEQSGPLWTPFPSLWCQWCLFCRGRCRFWLAWSPLRHVDFYPSCVSSILEIVAFVGVPASSRWPPRCQFYGSRGNIQVQIFLCSIELEFQCNIRKLLFMGPEQDTEVEF